MKSIVLALAVDIADTELGKDATVTVDTQTYDGIIVAILTHEKIEGVAQVVLEGKGLKVVSPP